MGEEITMVMVTRRGGPSPSQALPVVACILVAMLGVQAVGEADVEEQGLSPRVQQAATDVGSRWIGEDASTEPSSEGVLTPGKPSPDKTVKQEATDNALKGMVANLEKAFTKAKEAKQKADFEGANNVEYYEVMMLSS